MSQPLLSVSRLDLTAVSSIGNRSDGEESGRFAREALVVVAVDLGRLGRRSRFQEPFDQETGFV